MKPARVVRGPAAGVSKTPADRARLFESLHVHPADAWWLIGGYVKRPGAPDEPGVLLSTWAADKPWANGGLRIGARNACMVRYAF